MALVIEDGSIVPNANSFVTVSEIRTHATARGIVLPADDAEVEVLAIKAIDYIIAQEPQFQGARVDPTQTLPFPRTGVIIRGFEVEEDEIPIDVKQAQIQLAIDAQTIDLMPNVTGPLIKREKTGPLETEYAVGVTTAQNGPTLTIANSYLSNLYAATTGRLRTLRI